MSTNYSICVTQVANITAISSNTLVNGDGNFGAIFPAAIDYAEQRVYRELDLLVTRIVDATTQVSSGIRTFTLPTGTGTFLVVEEANIITPAATPSSVGTRNPLTMVSNEWIDAVWPQAGAGNSAQPKYCSMLNNTTLNLGPTPDAAYFMEIKGTQRPTPLSAANSSTFLTQVLPDLFNVGLMIFMSGQMRDFGAQSDNPQMAQSWENQFQTLLKSANVEELRKKYQSQGWSHENPSQIATPPRV